MVESILFISPLEAQEGHFYEREFPYHIISLGSFVNDRLGSKVDLKFLDMTMERIINPEIDYYKDDNLKTLIKNKIESGKSISSKDVQFLAISCFNSLQYLQTKRTLKIIQSMVKEGDISRSLVIVGGYHPSFVPGDFEGLGVDYIVRGEGEIALHDILNRYLEKERVPPDYLEESLIGESITDLDILPPTDFTLYEEYMAHYPRLCISLSRGCPMLCNFCIEANYAKIRGIKENWRPFSINRAKDEIKNVIKASDEYLPSNKTGFIGFYDPVFGYKLSWRREILEFLAELNPGYKIWTETRIDTIKERDVAMFKNANLFLMLGFESGSPSMLRVMNKTAHPREYLKNLEKYLLISKEMDYGPSVLNILLNFPGETEKSVSETFNYLESLIKKDVVFNTSISLYCLFPGDAVFSNIEHWERAHNAKIYFKDWWRKKETFLKGPIIDASKDFTFEKASVSYYEHLIHMFELMRDKVESPIYKLEFTRKISNEKKILEKRLNTYKNINLLK